MSDRASAPGTLFVVSAPSGAGKTSLVRALVAADDRVRVSVSHTTRARRDGERDGDHYFFVDADTFRRMVDDDAFLEHAAVFGNRYGTSRAAVQGQLDAGCDVVLEIDWQGARQVRRQLPDSTGVFVLPPSLEQLRTRLEGRAQDDPDTIARRMEAAVEEISHYGEYDFVVVNDDFQRALAELRAVVVATRLGQARQRLRLASLLAALLAGRGAGRVD